MARCYVCQGRYVNRSGNAGMCPACYKRRRAIAATTPYLDRWVVRSCDPIINGYIYNRGMVIDFILYRVMIGVVLEAGGRRYRVGEKGLEAECQSD